MNALQMDTEIANCLDTLRTPRFGPARVKTPVAKKLLLDNTTLTVNGQVRWLRFQSLGLGVYEVTLADLDGAKKNLIIKGK